MPSISISICLDNAGTFSERPDIRHSGAGSAAAIFGGHARVNPDGSVDYSMVKDSLVARTRIIQGSPALLARLEPRQLLQLGAPIGC